MGGVVSSIFGGANQSSPSIPETPVRENETEAEAKTVRDEEQRKIRARRGMAGTVLTSPLGTTQSQPSGILGRTISQG